MEVFVPVRKTESSAGEEGRGLREGSTKIEKGASGRNWRERGSDGAKPPWLILTSSWKSRRNYKGANTT